MLGLFSERNKKEEDCVFKYDEIPKKLRVQLGYIFVEDIIGERNHEGFEEIHKALRREYGVINMNKNPRTNNDRINLVETIHEEKDINKILDIIELSLRYKRDFLLNRGYYLEDIKEILDPIIYEINTRFKESSIGYEIVDGKFQRIDSEYTFSEIIKPALNLTKNKKFKNVNQEYLDALNEYKDRDNKDCLLKCLKSLESTLKIICDEKNWKYNENDGFKQLLDICYKNELIPSKIQSNFNGLRSTLESGVAPIRNKYSGHGQGLNEIIVEDYLAKYALNITGSCILLLIETSEI